MKKIVQRTKGFEKAFARLSAKMQKKFLEKLRLFLDNEYHKSLKIHQLKGKRKNEYVFSVTGDIRAIYKKEIRNNKTIIVTFTFINIGPHSQVY